MVHHVYQHNHQLLTVTRYYVLIVALLTAVRFLHLSLHVLRESAFEQQHDGDRL